MLSCLVANRWKYNSSTLLISLTLPFCEVDCKTFMYFYTAHTSYTNAFLIAASLLSPADLQRWRASKLHRWLRHPQEQLDALRQSSSLSGRTEPGGVPERRRHLLLHHQTGGAQPGAAGVVQPWVCPEALQPAGWHQTKWVQPMIAERITGCRMHTWRPFNQLFNQARNARVARSPKHIFRLFQARTCEFQLIYLVMMTKMLFAVWGVPSTVLQMPLSLYWPTGKILLGSRGTGHWENNWALSPYQGCKWHIQPAVSFSGKKYT